MEEASGIKGRKEKSLLKLTFWKSSWKPTRGADLRDKGNVKSCHKKCGNLKRRLPKKPPKVLSDRSHDIPTRKRIIPCASPDMQPGTVVYRKKERMKTIWRNQQRLYEERIRALEKKELESIEATKSSLHSGRNWKSERKQRKVKNGTHRLCQIGGAVESVLGCPIEEEDLPKLIGFLKRQETNGKFFSKAMQKEPLTDMEEV